MGERQGDEQIMTDEREGVVGSKVSTRGGRSLQKHGRGGKK